MAGMGWKCGVDVDEYRYENWKERMGGDGGGLILNHLEIPSNWKCRFRVYGPSTGVYYRMI